MTTRGIRNNNPGNIRHSPNFTWLGEINQDDDGFVIFDTMENGVRALARNLYSYQSKHGLNTTREIISRWAPPTENDTAAYIKSVAGTLGVDANADLDLTDVSTLSSLVAAITEHENGRDATHAAITAAVYVAGTQDALFGVG
jgi:hypothetical protein